MCRSTEPILRERANRQTGPVWCVCLRYLDSSVVVDQQSETRMRGHSPNSDSFPVMRSFQRLSSTQPKEVSAWRLAFCVLTLPAHAQGQRMFILEETAT